MSDHLRGKVESWICAHLALVPSLISVPSDGDHGLVPPYAVADVGEDSMETVGEMTSMMAVDVIYATSIHDTPIAAHAAQYRAVQAVMLGIRRGDVPELGLVVHGAQAPTGEVSGMAVSGEQAHGDVVTLAVGATDLGPPMAGSDIVDAFNRAGRRFSVLLGDGAARSFAVAHNLGVPLAAVLLRDAAAEGALHVCGRDYTLTVADANNVTVTLLPVLAGLAEDKPGIPSPASDGMLLTLIA